MEPATFASVLRAIAVLLVAIAAPGACASVHKTIKSDNGDVIDCVDIYQQPALKHASPGSQEIQAKPERGMKAMAAAASVTKLQERNQTWRKHGSCPAGTVPIRRASSRANPEVAELARRALPFGRPAGTAGNCSFDESTAMDTSKGKVEIAAAYATNGPYLGARSDLPYWRIEVHPGEFSMNYILVGYTLDRSYIPMPGAKPPANLTNQIAVGLVAWPSLYGDSLSRLFVYYTTDGGVANNCFNLDCGGFHIKEGSSFALGAAWADSDSQIGGVRHAVTVGIHRDHAGENWWVSVMDEDIGYYRESDFNTRFPEVSYVEMGGRVLDTRPGGAHTTTPMGNGMPASAGARFAATIMEYLGVSSEGVLFNDRANRTITTTPGCYGVKPLGFTTTRPGYDVAYGGPGGIYCDQPN